MRTALFIIVSITFILCSACSTKTHFKVPPDCEVRINHNNEAHKTGSVEIRPFFWTSKSGVKYELLESGESKILKEGELRTKFRVVSVFWPPYAAIYWPFGFACDCYDFYNDENECCYDNTESSE